MKPSPRLLLLPFSFIYCIITGVRNILFNIGVLQSQSYAVPLISVGNLTVGGTGKTPLTEYLIKLLSSQYHCALLSRGYGRKSKGAAIAGDNASPSLIGDEPMQMKQKFPYLLVAVAEKRILGMQKLLTCDNPPQVVILDDAFQHRRINPGLSILVIDYNRPVYGDYCLPAGDLRESRKGKKRAEIVVVNKCPADLSIPEKNNINRKLHLKSIQKLYFSTVHYLTPRQFGDNSEASSFSDVISDKEAVIIAVTGIAKPTPFFEHIQQYLCPVTKIAFPDHHHFASSDIKEIDRAVHDAGPKAVLLTTEKDAVRLKHASLSERLIEKIWYIPIELRILFNEQDNFNQTIEQYVETN
jgi:tetraacyldisaccharide 4'-kinase